MSNIKNLNYLNKDFNSLSEDLKALIQTYFPNNSTDLTDAQPGIIFTNQAAAIGDLLAFYQETQIQENFPLFAKDRSNIFNIAYVMGYRPKVTSTSTVDLDVYQLLPAILSGSVTVPNLDYCLTLDKGAICTSNNVTFITQEAVDFSVSSSYNPTEVNVYSIDATSNQPTYFLLKKQVKAIAGTIKQTQITFNGPTRFPEVFIEDDKIIEIIDVVDANGNKWYEVPYLAQETIFESISNSYLNNPILSQYSDTPNLLKLKRIPRRFVTRFKTDSRLSIQFGSGILNIPDEEFTPNLDNVGLGLIDSQTKLQTAYDPSNFLFTNTYGIAPYNTTLTFTYLVGGGVDSNVEANSITTLGVSNITFKNPNLPQNLADQIKASIQINNPLPASGGGEGDSNTEILERSIAAFSSQNRAVTPQDYLVRVLSMPPKFGAISKAYLRQDPNSVNSIDYNPFSLSIYILGYNNLKQLNTTSYALKKNLRAYLNESKIFSDAINLKDAYIVNIGVKFDITVLPNYNSQEVLNNCINTLKDYFAIERWQINQPIIISEVRILLDKVKGVQTVLSVEFENKVGVNNGYSQYGYDLKAATKNNIIYPSVNPCIFEIKYPNIDILGKVSTL